MGAIRHRLEADGTRQHAIALHVGKALRVDGVSAAQHRCGADRIKEKFKADWAVVVHALLHTLVIVLHMDVVT